MDEQARSRVLRRDPELAALVALLESAGDGADTDRLWTWVARREAERRSLASEALDRYRELNLLYTLAERATSLQPREVIGAAVEQLAGAVRPGLPAVYLLRVAPARLDRVSGPEDPSGPWPDHLPAGEGILGAALGSRDGEIVNHPAADPRAADAECGFGSLMTAALRAGDTTFGVLVVGGPFGTEYAAGQHRMLTAVAALTSPVLHAAIVHERAMDAARAREAELQHQLDALRDDLEIQRREERIRAITGTAAFQALRSQAADLRRVMDADGDGGTPDR